MLSYAVVSTNEAIPGEQHHLAVVVTDGERTRIIPADDEIGLSDIEWPTGEPDDVLRAGLANLYYFTVDGPHQFDGELKDSAQAIAAIYGLA